MCEGELEQELNELSSAEDFLAYFDIAYDPVVLQVNRLHILQRYHDYLQRVVNMPEREIQRRSMYKRLLLAAYNDFVKSSARAEKVLKVYRMKPPQKIFIPVSDLLLRVKGAS